MHSNFAARLKFGKLPARLDSRTLRLTSILKRDLPAVPDSFDVDQNLAVSIPPNMFGNDVVGDCVIAARANQTLRFEYFEQHKLLPISTADCLREYWREQACIGYVTKPDNGLVMLDSLKQWRKNGWKAADKKYKIHAFAAVPPTSQVQVKQSIYFLQGLQAGLQLPKSAMNQLDSDEPWAVTDVDPWILGGHCVNIKAYDQVGLTCLTWGKEQKMSWEWFRCYADESYAAVDCRDVDLPGSPVDEVKLAGILQIITS